MSLGKLSLLAWKWLQLSSALIQLNMSVICRFTKSVGNDAIIIWITKVIDTFLFSLLIKDGSCNGLQHYAALGRDQTGAESVNLFPADRPQDVYSNVAALVYSYGFPM